MDVKQPGGGGKPPQKEFVTLLGIRTSPFVANMVYLILFLLALRAIAWLF